MNRLLVCILALAALPVFADEGGNPLPGSHVLITDGKDSFEATILISATPGQAKVRLDKDGSVKWMPTWAPDGHGPGGNWHRLWSTIPYDAAVVGKPALIPAPPSSQPTVIDNTPDINTLRGLLERDQIALAAQQAGLVEVKAQVARLSEVPHPAWGDVHWRVAVMICYILTLVFGSVLYLYIHPKS